jgi:C-terminal processing protease CtpA/Prc
MEEEHEVIDDVPITILINCWSVSMSEMTSLSSKQMPNARLIGRRSWGGLCALTGQDEFTINYTGHIGEENKTPVFVYLPMVGIFDMNKKMLDGYGVEPDIEVDFDSTRYANTGYDSQLDRALQYIRTGN